MGIYAVLGVDFFGLASASIREDCDKALSGNPEITSITARGDCWGHEYFSSFSRSFYTFFQVLTGDSWSENVVRPIFFFFKDPVDAFFTAVFFVSFIVINAIILINVVVAVLLDKMAENSGIDENSEGSTDSEDPMGDRDDAEPAPEPPASSAEATDGVLLKVGSSEQLATAFAIVENLKREVNDLGSHWHEKLSILRGKVESLSVQIIEIQ